jgi:acyl transferase domain-containing protein
MDPQQRLLLEVAWEALEHAGLTAEQLAGSQTGVFIGLSTNDYCRLGLAGPEQNDAYASTGNAFSIAANRLSYTLDLHGPSLTIDTACSSALVALHYACQSLRSGESTAALVGGVNLILSPELSVSFSQARVLAADGRCKAFAEQADGYVRSEGCGVVVLKRLTDALRDGDNILAVVRGSAVNQDGRSNGLTAPNGHAQQAVIRQALADAAVRPAQIRYVEAHGTGTPLGDFIEIQALTTVLAEGRSPNQPCHIGSVKTNIGHTEAASGMAGLIKTVLALTHEEIPAHLHMQTCHPQLALEQSAFAIATERCPFAAGDEPRFASVHSFGFGGTNAHIIIEEAQPVAPLQPTVDRPQHLLALAAKTEVALSAMAGRYAEQLAAQPSVALGDFCCSANTGRTHFNQRLALPVTSHQQAIAALTAYRDGDTAAVFRRSATNSAPTIAFLFTEQWLSQLYLDRELLLTQPTFRRTITQCSEILRELGVSVSLEQRSAMHQTHPTPAQGAAADEVALQPARFVIAYALAQLWRAWGIEPAAVLGEQLGEYVAACIAGVFSPADALKLVVAHSGLQQKPGKAAADEFVKTAESITYYPPQIPLYGRLDQPTTAVATAAYWYDLANASVTPHTDSAHADQAPDRRVVFNTHGCNLVLEIGAYTALYELSADQLPTPTPAVADWSNWSTLLAVLGELYVRGMTVNWAGFERDYVRRRVALPTYPFQRERYWLPTTQREPKVVVTAGKLQNNNAVRNPLQGHRLRMAGTTDIRYELQVNLSTLGYLSHHRIFGEVIFPYTAYMEIALAAATALDRKEQFAIKEFAVQESLYLPADRARSIQVVLQQQDSVDYHFAIYSTAEDSTADPNAAGEQWQQHASGYLQRVGQQPPLPSLDVDAVRARCAKELSVANYYQRLQARGFSYGADFQAIRQLWQGNGEVLAEIRLPQSVAIADEQFTTAYHCHPVLLMACFQLAAATRPADQQNNVYMPVAVERIRLDGDLQDGFWCLTKMRSAVTPTANSGGSQEQPNFLIDLQLYRKDGLPIGSIEGVQLQWLGTMAGLVQLIRDDQAWSDPATHQPYIRTLRVISRSQQRQWLESYFQAEIARVAGFDANQLDVEQPLHQIGLDSLMAVELRNRVKTELGIDVPVVKFMEGITIAALATLIIEQLWSAPSADGSLIGDAKSKAGHDNPPATAKEEVVGDLLNNLDKLSDEDVDALLNSMLTTVEK